MFDFAAVFRFDRYLQIITQTARINRFLYYIHRIPLIGPKLPLNIFSGHNFKTVTANLLLIYGYIKKIMARILTLVAIFVWVYFVHFNGRRFTAVEFVQTSIISWAIVIGLGYAILSGTTFGGVRANNYRFASQFAQDYTLAIFDEYVLSTLVNGAIYTGLLLLLGMFADNFILILNVILLYWAMYLLALASVFYISARRKERTAVGKKGIRQFNVKSLSVGVLGWLFLIGSGLVVQFMPDFQPIIRVLTSGYFTVIPLLLIGLALFLNQRMLSRDNQATMAKIKRYDDQLYESITTNSKNEYVRTGTDMTEELQLETTSVSETAKLSFGTPAVIDALLFKRYRRILRKKILFKLAWIGAITLAFVIYFTLSRLGIIHFGNGLTAGLNFYGLLPVFFFWLYLLSIGKDVMSLSYTNLDSVMLTYPFYRQPQVVIKSFFYRFYQSFKYNMVMTLAVFAAVVVAMVIAGLNIALFQIFLFLVTLIALTALFSFHYLFVYYILQPFTIDKELKSPLFSLVNWLLYFIAYMQLNIPDNWLSYQYPVLIIGVTVMYVGIGALLIYRFAPQTFKLKK